MYQTAENILACGYCDRPSNGGLFELSMQEGDRTNKNVVEIKSVRNGEYIQSKV